VVLSAPLQHGTHPLGQGVTDAGRWPDEAASPPLPARRLSVGNGRFRGRTRTGSRHEQACGVCRLSRWQRARSARPGARRATAVAGPVTECGPLTTVSARRPVRGAPGGGEWPACRAGGADGGKKGHDPQCRPLLGVLHRRPCCTARHRRSPPAPPRPAVRRPSGLGPQQRTCPCGSAAHFRRASAGSAMSWILPGYRLRPWRGIRDTEKSQVSTRGTKNLGKPARSPGWRAGTRNWRCMRTTALTPFMQSAGAAQAQDRLLC